MYYWWTAERYCKSWDVPCLVRDSRETEQGKEYTIFSIDDGVETVIREETFKAEVRKSSRDEFEIYFLERVNELKQANLRLELEIQKNNLNIIGFQHKMGVVSMYPPEELEEKL